MEAIFLAKSTKRRYNMFNVCTEVNMNRNLKRYIRTNRDALVASSKELRAIFDIMFRLGDNVLCEGNDGFRTYRYTYAQMRQRITAAAAGLYQRIGATHGYVALEMDNSPEWIVAFWAVLMSGNKPYLVNLRYPGSLTAGILTTLDVRYILCTEPGDLAGTYIRIGELEGAEGTVPEEVFEDEIAFSSSATSMNEVICFYKGAQISAQILNFRSIVKECPRIAKHYKGSLKQLAFLPFYHVFGLFAVYFWFTFFGRTLVFLRDYSADTILQTCRRHQVTHIFAVPMLWHTIEKQLQATLRERSEKQQKKFKKGLSLSNRIQNLLPGIGPEFSKKLLKEVTSQLFGPSVLFCINGGSYLRNSAMELLNGLGYCMHNGYGMSEIGITSVELRSRPRFRNLNTIGRPFDSVEYRLDEQGTLQVRGSSLCTRKLVNGVEHRLEGWFNTGDNMICQDGYYTILGRQGDVVIGENGENINPDEIEKLFLVGKAKQLSVLGLPGENGQELTMVVQLSPYAQAQTVEQIRQEVYGINQTLPAASAIRKFYFTTDELAPPTAVKVSRTQLQGKIEAGQIKLVSFPDYITASAEEENSPLMADVKQIIAKVLDIPVETVEAGSHIFFDLGGSSIQYFSILTALSEHFQISGYEQTDKYCYTPSQICQYIERRM
jgi:long-subunit acyl-CoA synthetase (AMP-forming)/acyl carrier protein